MFKGDGGDSNLRITGVRSCCLFYQCATTIDFFLLDYFLLTGMRHSHYNSPLTLTTLVSLSRFQNN